MRQKKELQALGDHACGWQSARVERAAQAVACFATLDSEAARFLDEIRASLPAAALASVWWQ